VRIKEKKEAREWDRSYELRGGGAWTGQVTAMPCLDKFGERLI